MSDPMCVGFKPFDKSEETMLNNTSLHGEWEVVHGVCTPGGDPLLICPFCHGENTEHLGGIEMPKKWNYCPNCGAELKGDGHI